MNTMSVASRSRADSGDNIMSKNSLKIMSMQQRSTVGSKQGNVIALPTSFPDRGSLLNSTEVTVNKTKTYNLTNRDSTKVAEKDSRSLIRQRIQSHKNTVIGLPLQETILTEQRSPLI